ncbi:MAG: 16S rRNA (cytosine(1402)-N(4))-methyltransferase RsmH, partial [Candidatus Saccharimonadales bacterium]
HASAILNLSGNYKQSVLIDRDEVAIRHLRNVFKGRGISLRHQDFVSASKELLLKKRAFDIIIADLGVSSPHLNEVSRGFSFAKAAPLDMRMDQRQEVTAGDIVNHTSEKQLAEILRRYGEEPRYRQIARLIVSNRPIISTTELSGLVSRAWAGHSRIHPATRTFMAIRIAVNDELTQLSQALPIWLKLLAPGGRIAIISFHSLEDRIAKQFLASESGNRYDAALTLLTKHPVAPGPHEIANNPRSRSAKLRVAVKQKRKGTADANSGKKQLPGI